MRSEKNPGVAALLALLFGPIGMLYSTIAGAIIMFIVDIIVFFLTFGFGLLITWPISPIWAAIAASNYNASIRAQAHTAHQQPPGY